jgi:hypothetical protein
MFGSLNLYAGAAAGVALAAVVGWGYNTLIDNPSVVRETTVKVEAEARERTYAAINEVNNEAERARAMRRFCRDSGKLYDFETNKCREG